MLVTSIRNTPKISNNNNANVKNNQPSFGYVELYRGMRPMKGLYAGGTAGESLFTFKVILGIPDKIIEYGKKSVQEAEIVRFLDRGNPEYEVPPEYTVGVSEYARQLTNILRQKGSILHSYVKQKENNPITCNIKFEDLIASLREMGLKLINEKNIQNNLTRDISWWKPYANDMGIQALPAVIKTGKLEMPRESELFFKLDESEPIKFELSGELTRRDLAKLGIAQPENSSEPLKISGNNNLKIILKDRK